MLRDYAVSMTLILFVLLGYTALLFWKKPESGSENVSRSPRIEVRTEASVHPTTTSAASEASAEVVEHN